MCSCFVDLCPLTFLLNNRVYADVPEGCVIIREHIPITNLFTCLWFNEVDRFTSRDQLSFSTVRDKIMAKVNWSINMFLDCERRNFVIQVHIYVLPCYCHGKINSAFKPNYFVLSWFYTDFIITLYIF